MKTGLRYNQLEKAEYLLNSFTTCLNISSIALRPLMLVSHFNNFNNGSFSSIIIIYIFF